MITIKIISYGKSTFTMCSFKEHKQKLSKSFMLFVELMFSRADWPYCPFLYFFFVSNKQSGGTPLEMKGHFISQNHDNL